MSDEFKPGDLAWVTAGGVAERLARRGVLESSGQLVWWFLDSGTWTVDHNARPAEVLQPGERKVPAGCVVLDPGSDEHARDTAARVPL